MTKPTRVFLPLTLTIILCLCNSIRALADDDNNAQITALFLYNFVNFSEWPDQAFDSSDSPIQMCLYGNIPTSTYLDSVNGTIIGTRKLHVLRTQELNDIRNGCHVLFVSEDRHAELPEFWKDINYYYVLSVGEQEAFTDKGGIINIMRTQDQLSFDINVSNALEAGLFLEADLLNLARKIQSN